MATLTIETNPDRWPRDGKGVTDAIDGSRFDVKVETPLTLWCPREVPSRFSVSFDCCVHTPGSAMLLLLCARPWRGSEGLLERPRTGAYADYAYSDLEMYSVGFNRTAHVSCEVQPNASTANIRRIGGPVGVAFADLNLTQRTPEMMRRWASWDETTLLCSMRETASGVGQWYSYSFRCAPRRLECHMDGVLQWVVIDHQAVPLVGGYWAVRNMTPGASFSLRNVLLESWDETGG